MTNVNKSVELNRDNINKCLCAECPVQIDSECSKDKLDIINEKLKEKGDINDLIKPEELVLVDLRDHSPEPFQQRFARTCMWQTH